jgi:hypothetical protein
MIATLVLLLLASTMFAPVAEQPPARQDDTPPFLVGVLRRDGIVSPFAAFDGKNWSVPWPANLRFLEIPIGLDSVPSKWWGKGGPVAQVTAWIDGVNRGTLKVNKPTVVPVMCASQLGLASDYRSPQPVPPLMVQPFPKDGLAVSGAQRVEPIETLAATSPDWGATGPLLREPFDQAEEDAIRAFTAWKHPVRKEDRRKLAIELETMYRAPMDEPGWTASYVEAVRRFPPGPDDDDCGLMTSARGWIIAGPGGKRTVKLTARVTYCDRRGMIYMLPLGLLKTRGRTYWAYQLSGYGQEAYVIAHPQPKVVMMEAIYSPGGCPY